MSISEKELDEEDEEYDENVVPTTRRKWSVDGEGARPLAQLGRVDGVGHVAASYAAGVQLRGSVQAMAPGHESSQNLCHHRHVGRAVGGKKPSQAHQMAIPAPHLALPISGATAIPTSGGPVCGILIV